MRIPKDLLEYDDQGRLISLKAEFEVTNGYVTQERITIPIMEPIGRMPRFGELSAVRHRYIHYNLVRKSSNWWWNANYVFEVDYKHLIQEFGCILK